MFALRP